ncbi:SOS response-associated peptidase [Silanimonas sp.]|jgi:putative SOS response-associated peptidase YedK|uniref:SOS response-associated peptidase n=1 Tax=Silanimonas sp. TaxID=1929290 RepID=UPI0037CBB04B
MCGRFTQAVPWSAVWAFSQPLVLAVPDEPLSPRYNIAPTQSVWVIAGDGAGGAKVGAMRWGLVPGWANSLPSGLSTFNARIESVAMKPTFQQVFGRRHCLIPVGGYYEWVGTGRAKQPWYITPSEDQMMFFAGLWDRWMSPTGEALLSFTVLTAPADGGLARLHDHRPMIIPAVLGGDWLSAGPKALSVLTGLQPPDLRWHPVAIDVGNVRSDHSGLIEPVAAIDLAGSS